MLSPYRGTFGKREESYTSQEASRLSGVPFFTVDYWGRTKFLVPTISQGSGRGRGRERMYSFSDVIRLRIARELREQKVSLQSLRSILTKLGRSGIDLSTLHYVIVTQEVESARSTKELVTILSKRNRKPFGVILDLRALTRTVKDRRRELTGAE